MKVVPVAALIARERWNYDDVRKPGVPALEEAAAKPDAKAEEKEEAEEAADPAEAGAAPEVAALEEDAAPEAHPTVPPLIEAPGEAAERKKDKMNPAFRLAPKAPEAADAAHEAYSVYASNFGFAKLFDTTVEEAEQQPSSLTRQFRSLF